MGASVRAKAYENDVPSEKSGFPPNMQQCLRAAGVGSPCPPSWIWRTANPVRKISSICGMRDSWEFPHHHSAINDYSEG